MQIGFFREGILRNDYSIIEFKFVLEGYLDFELFFRALSKAVFRLKKINKFNKILMKRKLINRTVNNVGFGS